MMHNAPLSHPSLRYIWAAVLLIAIPLSSANATEIDISQHIPEESALVRVSESTIDGERYDTIWYLDEKTNNLGSVHLHIQGDKVDKPKQTIEPLPILRPSLADALDQASQEDALFKVAIAMHTPVIEYPNEDISEGAARVDDGHAVVRANNQTMTKEDLKEYDDDISRVRKGITQQRKRMQIEASRDLVRRNPWISSDKLTEQIDQGRPTLVAYLSKDNIDKLLETSSDLIAGIELYVEPVEELEGAMLSTGIDPFAMNQAATSGDGIGIYMTEPGCPDDNAIQNYMRLNGNVAPHAERVAIVIREVSPESFIYCRGNTVLPNLSDHNGVGGNPSIRIANISAGVPPHATNNEYSIGDRDWDNLAYSHRILLFKSAGNEGNQGEVTTPGKGYNTIAVGNYNHNNDTIWHMSSGLNPNNGHRKPELVAPGTALDILGFPNPDGWTGTSYSAPHTTAFSANLLSAFQWMRQRPAVTKAHLLSSSTNPILGDFNVIGVGGINFQRAYFGFQHYWFHGPNSSYYSAQEPGTNYIERKVHLNASVNSVRAAFVWMNTGSYAYNTGNLDMQFILEVYSPDDQLMGFSMSPDNPYQLVEFVPTVSGEYSFRIYRVENNQSSTFFEAGLSVSW